MIPEVLTKKKRPRSQKGKRNTRRPIGRKVYILNKMSGCMPRQNFPDLSRSGITRFSKDKSAIWNRRYLNKAQQTLALSFLRLLWMLIRKFEHWLKQHMPIRQLRTVNNTRIIKPELQLTDWLQSPKRTQNHEKKKGSHAKKAVTLLGRLVLGKSLIKAKNKIFVG